MKFLKGYGKRKRVCYRHRAIIGAACISFGKCENCKEQVSAAVGSPPKLCDNCSVELSECAECRVALKP